MNNLCPTQKFSRWIPASNGMLQLIESQFDSRCHYLTDNECRRIIDEYMLVQSFEHFYVRKGDLMENFHSAMRSALKKLARLVSLLNAKKLRSLAGPRVQFQGAREGRMLMVIK